MNASRVASVASCGVAFDTETWLIQPGVLAPPLVCGSLAARAADGSVVGEMLGKRERDPEMPDTLEVFQRVLDDDRTVIVGANIAFDMLVMAVFTARRGLDLMPSIFDAYEAERVFDIQTAEALNAIAGGHLGTFPGTRSQLRDPITGKVGRYSLAIVVDQVLGRRDAKENDEWRFRYAELDPFPVAQWPETARVYPVDDARNTLEAALGQVGAIPSRYIHSWRYDTDGSRVCLRCADRVAPDADASPDCWALAPRRNLHDLAAQVYASFSLHLGAAWGIRTDPDAVEFLARAVEGERSASLPRFIEAGLVRADGSEDTAAVKRAVALAYGCSGLCRECGGSGKLASAKTGKPINCTTCGGACLDLDSAPVPRTDPSTKFAHGQIKTGRDELIESGDELLMEYGYSQEDDKILDTYIPFLREASRLPMNLRPNNPLETGRVSYSGVIQLLPRQVSARLAQILKRMRVEWQETT